MLKRKYIEMGIKFVTGWKEMFYLMMHSTHFSYGYIVSDILCQTILLNFVNTAISLTFSVIYKQTKPTSTGEDFPNNQFLLIL